MLTLVKTLRTFVLSDVMDWAIAKKRITGVTNLGGDTVGMSFQINGHGKTKLYSKVNSGIVAFMTIFEPSSHVENMKKNMEQDIMDRILTASGVNTMGSKKISTTRVFNNYYVFEIKPEQEINNVRLEYRLRVMGVKTIMDFDLYDAVVAKISGVTWHFFNSNRVIAVIGGKELEESIVMVQNSWSFINE